MEPKYPHRIQRPAEPIDWRLRQPIREWLLWLVAATTTGLLPIQED